MSELLPPNSTPFEHALVEGMAHESTTDPKLPRNLFLPHEAPKAFLPWLAWECNVPIWPKGAHEKTQRGLIEASFRLHQLRGTEAGFAIMCEMVGAKLVKVVAPPSKTFLAPSLTKAERERFLDKFPQLRFYRYRDKGKRQGAMFHKLFMGPGGNCFPVKSDAVNRIGERPVVWDKGVETNLAQAVRTTEVTVKEAVTYEDVSLPGKKGYGFFLNTVPNAQQFLIRSDAKKRMYRLKETEAYNHVSETVHRQAVGPGFGLIDVKHELVGEKGQRRGVFIGASYVGSIFNRSDAYDRVYRRWYLHDPDRQIESRGVTTHLGTMRLGMPPHNAEITVELLEKIPARATSRFVSGFLVRTPKTKYYQLLEALKFAKRKSDRILVNTASRQPAKVGNQHLVGSLKAGEWI